jgi:hypothetical protein
MNTRSARENTMFAPAQLLCNWREKRPNKEGNFDSSATGEVGRVYYTGADLPLIFRLSTVVRDCCWVVF